jgi:phage baseplate assembly protein W
MLFDSSFGEKIAFKDSYSDLDFNFKINPNYGDIVPLRDNNCIKASIKNLVMTNFFDRPFNQYVGVGIRDYVFDKMDTITLTTLAMEIKRVILTHEPRISDLKVYALPDDTTLYLTIVFEVMNTGVVDSLNLPLERLR